MAYTSYSKPCAHCKKREKNKTRPKPRIFIIMNRESGFWMRMKLPAAENAFIQIREMKPEKIKGKKTTYDDTVSVELAEDEY